MISTLAFREPSQARRAFSRLVADGFVVRDVDAPGPAQSAGELAVMHDVDELSALLATARQIDPRVSVVASVPRATVDAVTWT